MPRLPADRRPAAAGHRERGFTLVEVMVALAIAALALGAVAASVSQMVEAAIAMEQRTYATWIGLNKIAELRLANTVPEVGEDSDEITYAGRQWTWQVTISETDVEDLFRVDVDVSLAGSDDVIRRVTGFIGEPTQPGVANSAWSGAAFLPGTGPDGEPGDSAEGERM
jgi:general secretion pathway protein I